jgi:autotransporter-associated beta strand protein
MKMNRHLDSRGTSAPEKILQKLKSVPARGCHLFILALTFIFIAADARAAVLAWDAGNTNNGGTIDPGSGSWSTDTTTNFNWNNGTGNVSWTQTSTTAATMGAMFGGLGAADGTYQVTMDGTQVAATNLQINANGYSFSGSPIYLTAGGPVGLLTVSNGVTVYFTNNLTGNNGNADLRMGDNGAPATVVLYGTMTGWQPTITSTNGSVFYLAGSGTNVSGTTIFNADVRMTNGTFNSPGAFIIGRIRGAGSSQPNNATGVFTLDGPNTILNQTSDYISIGRDNVWNSTMIIQNGATVNYQIGVNNNNLGLGIPRPGSSGANNQSWVKVFGGTLNMGPGTESPQLARPIFIANGGSRAGENSILVQTGGMINAWSGIQIGGTGTYDGGTGAYTNSGGFLYLGSIGGGGGIRYGALIPPTNSVSLSGGTIGALQNWISSVPMILDGNNGNITFQCADTNSNPFNISLSGSLTGPGGLYKTGPGVLTLTGTNNYAGSTVISNGTLVISTAHLPVNGSVVLDGSSAAAGLPLVSNIVASAGQSWTMTNLTFSSGTPTLAFNFSGLTPSTTIASIQDNGDLAFTVTPAVSVDGSALAVGDYPLIHYTGTLSGTPPTTPSQLPGGVTATIVNNTGAKTIVLHVTSGPQPTLTWKVGNGAWDINNTANWTQFGASAKYQDGEAVQFDDSASGTSPIIVSLNTVVNPSTLTAINATKSYIVSGTGAIAGSAGVSVLGAGGLTLATTNTYTGGTTVTGPGLLNITYGGNGGADSSIGTGPLILNTGAKLDNTSGQPVVLNTGSRIPMNWNDDWTFVGSTNLDLGLGLVTLGNTEVILTVVSNTLTVNNTITDNGNGFKLTKQGNGTLTLSNPNNPFSGGLDLEAGTLNLNGDSAGSGIFNIGGGVIDNTSGAAVFLSTPSKLDLLANFTFNGTTNLDLGGAPTTIGNNTITLNGTGALITEGPFLGGNRLTTVAGTGKWIIGGFGGNSGLDMTINGGTIYLNKSAGNAIGGGNSLTVNTGGSVVVMNPSSTQFAITTPVTLGGGLIDMNGDTETVQSFAFRGGILRDSAPGSFGTLTVTNPATFTLAAASNCVFDVTASDAIFNIAANISGSGTLVQTGLGTLSLLNSNSYTGDTIISNGTMILSYPDLAPTSTVSIGTNAVLGTNGVLVLNFQSADTNVVGALVLGGVSKPAGVYSATTDPLYIQGPGSLEVVSASTINPNPGTIQFNVSGNTLNLAWPTNLGWLLQGETNPPGVGINSSNWVTVQGSGSVTNLGITINVTNGATFFRLLHP